MKVRDQGHLFFTFTSMSESVVLALSKQACGRPPFSTLPRRTPFRRGFAFCMLFMPPALAWVAYASLYAYAMTFFRRKLVWLGLAVAVGGVWFVLQAKTDYPPFDPNMRKGELFLIPAQALHPTQSMIGFREVKDRTEAFNRKSADKLAAKLQDTNTVMIIGPGGIPYLNDGHHAVRALLDSNQPNKNVYGIVVENWSDMAPADFWKKMVEQGDAYLFDSEHKIIDPANLPTSVSGCVDDPYRDLAASVCHAGGYAKDIKVFYQEFIWADYFRPLVKWNNSNDADYAHAVKKATKLAHEPAAAALPGYSLVPLNVIHH